MRLAGKARDFPDIQQHLLVGVIVPHLDQRARHADHDAQLFMEFAGQGNFNGFVVLDLATWKLPQPTLMLGIGTAGDENLAAAIADDGGGYVHSLH
ncbi:hypothetical protein D3C84_842310 [compost metagenome]